MSYDFERDRERRVCLFPIPNFFSLTEKKRDAGIYISGGMFALGWWFFIDSVVYSNHLREKGDDTVPFVNFEDWLCGIFSTLGMIIINSINKSHLTANNYTYAGSNETFRARLFLFVGFAALAGGLAGSFTILILKYIVTETPHTYFGIALIVQNLSIMLSSFTLWIAQSAEGESGYNHFLY